MESLSVRLARGVFWFVAMMVVIGIIGLGVVEVFGNTELIRLRLEAASAEAAAQQAEAEAARELATADRLRAAAEKERADGEAAAIRAPAEAAAWAVRVQTTILAWYAVAGPVGLFAAALAVAVGSGSVGVVLGCIGGVLLSQKYDS